MFLFQNINIAEQLAQNSKLNSCQTNSVELQPTFILCVTFIRLSVILLGPTKFTDRTIQVTSDTHKLCRLIVLVHASIRCRRLRFSSLSVSWRSTVHITRPRTIFLVNSNDATEGEFPSRWLEQHGPLATADRTVEISTTPPECFPRTQIPYPCKIPLILNTGGTC